MTLHGRLAEWSAWIWPQMGDHLWQATLFAALAWAAVLALRGSHARFRHAVWLVASAKFAIPAGLLVAAAARVRALWPSETGAAVDFGPLLVRMVEPFGSTVEVAAGHNELLCALTVLWLAGVAVFLFRWAARLRLGSGLSAAGPVESQALARVQARLGWRGPIRLLLSPTAAEPLVWGLWRPRLILPAGMAGRLTAEELEAVLAHEVLHVVRRDNLTASLHRILGSVYWFCPVVWWIERRLLEERERACDEGVVEATGTPEAYASGVLKVCRFGVGVAVPGAAGVSGSSLRRRVEGIMSQQWGRPAAGAARLAVVGMVVMAVGLPFVAGSLQSQAPPVAPRRSEVRHVEFVRADGTVEKDLVLTPEKWVLISQLRRTDWSARLALQPDLPPRYAKWLAEDVAWIIGDEERALFLALRSDADRESFIEAFWRVRDPDPSTPQNKFKDEHYRRIAWSNQRFAGAQPPGWRSDRGRLYIQLGPPDEIESHPSDGFEIWTWRRVSGTSGGLRIRFEPAREP
jgi:GWxTD domain-containing protein